MKKLNIQNKEVHFIVLFGLLALLFISANFANDYTPQDNFISDNKIPKTAAISINIVSPVPNDNFSVTAPNFVVEINDDADTIDTMWYTIDGGATNITFLVNGTIDQTEWTAHAEGLVVLTFYANNSVSDEDSASVNINKDTGLPSVSITYPLANGNFSATAPNYIVEISDTESLIDTMWYTLDGGLTNITFLVNGTIDQTAWNTLVNGLVTIIFFANDSAGNENFAQVVVNKDTVDPAVSITDPSGSEYYGATAPSYTVEIGDFNLDSMWYTIDSGATNITFTVNGTIDQTEWTALGDGSITMIFYANDSAGNTGFDSVTVNKDTGLPTVSITDPTGGEYFGATAPSFTVEIFDDNLDTMWYTIDGGATNITFLVNGTIDQTEWDALGDGLVTMVFYANDTAGGTSSDNVIVNKDVVDPAVSITDPTGGEYYAATAPSFTVEIADNNLDTMWYTIDSGVTNITFLVNGTIDQTEWTAHVDGSVTITFFANDSAGNENFAQVVVNKDVVDPAVSITDPTGGEYYGAIAPSFTVEIADFNLDTMWYTIDNGATNITFLINGTIDQTEWTALSDGSVTMIFYANDTAGNINSDSVIVNKDTSNPIVSITSPTGGEYFGTLAPNFIVEISDSWSPIDTMWYTIDNGITNITFIINGTIDQTEWTAHGDGPVTIYFYANDTVGNIGFDSVVINKDTGNPTVSITTPTGGEFYSVTAPNFVVEISDTGSPIDTMWYTIDGGLTNFTFSVNGTIDQNNWTAISDGIVTIIFYANDSAGNVNFAQVLVNKDVIDPSISITSPTGGQYIDVTAPGYTVEITDNNLDTMWYTIDGGATNITFLLNGTIDQTEWTALGDGQVVIIFYANDSAGNLAFDQVIVNKDTTAPSITILSPLSGTYGVTAPNFIVQISDAILHTMWYTIDGGVKNITFVTNGTIDQAEWTNLANGPVTLTFYANDTFGHESNASSNFEKNAEAPVISIVSPSLASNYGLNSPSFVVEITDTDLHTMWYTIDGGITNFTFVTNGTIDQTEWTGHSDGDVRLIFYANDSAGNIATAEVIINKDTVAPTINILSPMALQLLGVTAPSFSVEIDDPILLSMWYSLDGGLNNYTFTVNGTIDQSAWNSIPNGTITIYFYANDLVENEAFAIVLVRVDKIIPTITVNLPVDDTVIGTQPIINITVNDVNVHSIWYRVGSTVISLNSYNNTDVLLNILIWNALPEGLFTIEFFANDTAGNLNSIYSVDLTKDINAPIVNIVHPVANATYTVAPQITLTITDATLDTTWYTIVGINSTFVFEGTTGTNYVTIDQATWNALSNGDITILFYANDSLGRISSDSITIKRNVPVPFDFLGFLFGPIGITIMISVIAVIVVVLLLRRRKFHKTSDKEVRKIESLWD